MCRLVLNCSVALAAGAEVAMVASMHRVVCIEIYFSWQYNRACQSISSINAIPKNT